MSGGFFGEGGGSGGGITNDAPAGVIPVTADEDGNLVAGTLTETPAVAQTGSLTVVTQPDPADALSVGNKTYAFVAGAPGVNEIQIGANATATAANITSRINADTADALCTAIQAGTTVNLTANVAGSISGAGGFIVLSADGVHVTVVEFSGGLDTTISTPSVLDVLTIIPADEFSLQPVDSEGNGLSARFSGGNAANGFSGGDAVMDGGGEIDGGGSGSITAKGADSGDGGDVEINPGPGDTSGVVNITSYPDGGGAGVSSILSAYKWLLGPPVLQFGSTGSRIANISDKITIRNTGNTANGDFEAQNVTATESVDVAGDLSVGGRVGFYGVGVVDQPNVPPVATPQNIVDALIALGLVTQS